MVGFIEAVVFMANDKKELKEEKKVKPKKRKWIIIGIIIVVVVIVVRVRSNKNKDIETAVVQRGTIKEELILSGEIVADEHAQLTFETSGKIEYVGVKEGDVVKKGQLLSKLETTNLNSDYQRAREDLRDAEATLDRVYDDLKGKDDTENLTERETRTGVEKDKNKAWEAVIKAERNLRGASLFAPFTGIVTYVANPFPGLSVLYTITQVELLNPETIYFDVSADQSEVTSLHEGDKVTIILDSFIDSEFGGIVDVISLTPDAGKTGTVYKVRILLDDPTLNGVAFRIGMTGDAKFTLSEASDVLLVPSNFVNTQKGEKYVNLGRKNNKVFVDIGVEGEDDTEITGEAVESEEIKEGDTVYD